MAAPKRRQMLGETRLVTEYILERYPGRRWVLNMRLGTAPQVRSGLELSESEQRMLSVWQRYADAVVLPPPDLVVIEAKIWDSIEAVGPLQQYLAMVPHTAELREWLSYPIRGEIVTAQYDPVAEAVARRNGLGYVVFAPAWLEEFFALYPHRRRRAPSAGLLQLPPGG